MRVALIGDVHANLPALEAVLAHARQEGANAIWNVGDFVGFGAVSRRGCAAAARRLCTEHAW